MFPLRTFTDTEPPPSTKRPKRITVLGATGSIGESTLDLVGRDPEAYEVVALTGCKNGTRLAELAIRHRAKLAVVADPESYGDLTAALAGTGIEAAAGQKALLDAASRPADWIMAAIVGAAGLKPTLHAVRQGTATALANKECLVSAGRIFMAEVARHGTTLLPVDSEHSAALQAMTGTEPERIERVCLTASGGPFRTWSLEQMAAAGPEQALKHPNWSMGAKVTIDSATLMNKGLELLEAHHLFALAPEKLDVLVHPQSIVHCLVQMSDGAVLAQLSCPDMRTPIAYSLAWPERMHVPNERLDLAQIGSLTFEAPDLERFPALRLAKEALAAGGSAGTVLNAANEVAVAAFLEKRLGFLAIAGLVESTLAACPDLICLGPQTADDVLEIDEETRRRARGWLPRFA
ncbi:1-deoxy-D-xylulose 5-phosphate reductoisomerase [Methyloceanibacter marginalis]|uniref:1-deoxy-D-xylulose 5-phosphate reductoisomerase n=1 Tax=Methyloceanibacter marginalis TaxID=1774971 RepID=A0A1E3WA42_9HYPH|nr:1-deoxy-D-xylulose-5-phosphate reductoisomerase [Methyloceanibacter marginalis]ODS02695.1 1-deoxy-D-xylulose 5-phosphate reductoisomerase [Methyloceanibacter marginalis]